MTGIHRPTPVLLSPAEAATYARVKPGTLRMWKARYRLTGYQRRGVNYYDLHELAAVLEGRAG